MSSGYKVHVGHYISSAIVSALTPQSATDYPNTSTCDIQSLKSQVNMPVISPKSTNFLIIVCL